MKFNNLSWILIIVGIPNPNWLCAKVGNAGQMFALPPVRKSFEVKSVQTSEIGTNWLVGYPFDLNSALIARDLTANYQCNKGIVSEIAHFP